MKFEGTKGKWIVDIYECGYNDFNQLRIPISRKDASYSTIIGLCDVYGEDEESKANALLISKSPILLEEHEKEIEFLKRVKKQLDDLGGSMEYEVEERIKYLEKLCLESVTLQF